MVEQSLCREEFIKQNLPLVHSLCKRFCGRGIEYEDLYQAGCIGLIKAADAFDSTKGFAFSTYAVPVIMGEIRRLFRDGGAVKVSRSLKELYMKITHKKSELEQKLYREPTVSELALELGVTPEDVTEAISAGMSTVSLTINSEDGVTETDLPCKSYEDDICNKVMLDSVLKYLNEDEKLIVKYRYYNSFTQSKTARLLNMSQVQVSRAEKRILLKLRKYLS